MKEEKSKNLDIKEMAADNEAFYSALKSYDIKVFGNYLKKWKHKMFKRYNRFNDIGKKKVLCNIIIDYKDKLNDDKLYQKAKKWFDDHNREVLNK